MTVLSIGLIAGILTGAKGGIPPPPHQLYLTWGHGTRCYSEGRQDLRMYVRGW